MAFTVRDFPGRLFETIEEYEQAKEDRSKIETALLEKNPKSVQVKAVILPAEHKTLEQRIASLEVGLNKLGSAIQGLQVENPSKEGPGINKEGLPIGTTLHGESKGRSFTLEVTANGYLCSDGVIYHSLSGAALGVSGNRRSGWRFWGDDEGNSIGSLTGRFEDHVSVQKAVPSLRFSHSGSH